MIMGEEIDAFKSSVSSDSDFLFSSRQAAFITTKLKLWKNIQTLDFWKMYRNQVTNSSAAFFMDGIFLKEILCGDYSFITSLKSL